MQRRRRGAGVWGCLMGTLTKRDLVERVAAAAVLDRASVRVVVCEFLEQVKRALAAGHRLELRDFGVFETRSRAARVGRNPQTLREVAVPARRAVRFKAGRRLRDLLGGESAPERVSSGHPERDGATPPGARRRGRARRPGSGEAPRS